MPSPVRFAVVRQMLESAGYVLARISGSHHIFTKTDADPVSVPVHKNHVKYGYVRRIQKIIDAEEAAQADSEVEEQRDGEAGKVQSGDLENGHQDGE
jgi:predicted RNA binding protein YcfA (HicA-like mRNA interferase family)